MSSRFQGQARVSVDGFQVEQRRAAGDAVEQRVEEGAG
jgi:hypothetical protein